MAIGSIRRHLVLASLAIAQAVIAVGADRVTLNFETQGLDLDTGTVVGHGTSLDVFMNHPEADIRISYHADRPVHSVVIHHSGSGVELALLPNTGFDGVTAASLPSIVFDADIIDQPFNPGDTFVVRTDLGNYYKIGNSAEDSTGASFEFEVLGTRRAGPIEPPWSDHALALILLLTSAIAVGRREDFLGTRNRIPLSILAGLTLLMLSAAVVRALDGPTRLTATDGATGDFFGISVSVDRNMALVGANLDEDAGSRSGSAYVFTRDGIAWTESAKLTATDGAASDEFGSSVSLHHNTALVGAPHDDDHAGSAYVFTRGVTGWSETAKLTADGGGFGVSVSLDGDAALVGAPLSDGADTQSGSAYVFRKDALGNWLRSKLIADDGARGDLLGASVFLDGDTALVGALWDDDSGGNSGSVYVFTKSTTGWSQTAKLTASDGASTDNFGERVSLDGDTALVGATLDDDAGSASGSAYVFTRTREGWREVAKLTASDGAPLEFFGSSVAIDGNVALIGARAATKPGSLYVFTRDATGWSEKAKLEATSPVGGLFGSSVSIDAGTVLVGAPGDRGADFVGGSAYAFQRTSSPRERVEDLIEKLKSLKLRRGTERSLVVKLEAVLRTLEDGNIRNDRAAVHVLQAFINAVEAQPSKRVPEAEADELIADAQEIIDLLWHRGHSRGRGFRSISGEVSE